MSRTVSLLLLLAACHQGSSPTTRSATPALGSDTTIEGVVTATALTGGAGVALVTSAGQVPLSGALEPELATLLGARVRVEGAAESSPFPPTRRRVAVQQYTILEVAGGVPVVGILRRIGDEFEVDGVRLTAVPRLMAEAEGRKVWVVGTAGSAGLSVQAFGVIGPSSR